MLGLEERQNQQSHHRRAKQLGVRDLQGQKAFERASRKGYLIESLLRHLAVSLSDMDESRCEIR